MWRFAAVWLAESAHLRRPLGKGPEEIPGGFLLLAAGQQPVKRSCALGLPPESLWGEASFAPSSVQVWPHPSG